MRERFRSPEPPDPHGCNRYNIANGNTAGFKKSQVVFKDMLYQNVRASNPTGSRAELTLWVWAGHGFKQYWPDSYRSPATSTSKLTDMAIDGNGYFVVNDGNTGIILGPGRLILTFRKLDQCWYSGYRLAGQPRYLGTQLQWWPDQYQYWRL